MTVADRSRPAGAEAGPPSARSAARATACPTSRWARLVPLVLLAAGFAAFFALGLQDRLTLEHFARHRAALTAFVAEREALAALAYVVLYALSVAFSVPGATVLTVAGGFLFGTVAASLYVTAGATAGAAAVFLAARSAMGRCLRDRAGPWACRLECGFRENAFNYMLVLRLVPLFPFWLVNLVPAVLGVPFGTYVLATLLGIVPGVVVYASVGNGLGAVLDAGGTPDLGVVLAPDVMLPLVGLALLALLPVAVRAWRKRR